MSQHAKTDDKIELNQKYREKAEWIERFLGMKVPVRDRLDLADTTTAESAQNAVPVILDQVKDMMAPLSTGPKADVSELRLALSKAKEIQTDLTGKTPTPHDIVDIRRKVGELPGLVTSALSTIKQLDQRREELIRDASLLVCTGEADPSAEGELITHFKDRQAAVPGAFADGILTTDKVLAAETALATAQKAVREVAEAVQKRLRSQLVTLIEEAGKLQYSEGADPEPEAGLIQTFTMQQKAVSVTESKGALTADDIVQAKDALAAAKKAVGEIADAVQQRHEAWAKRIVQKADELIARYEAKGLDSTLWAKPRATREAIDRELMPS